MRLTAALSLVFACASTAIAGGGPENVLVVVNDLCEDSAAIARYYMERRGIPRHHVVHVKIPGAPARDPKAPFVPAASFASFDAFREQLESPVKRWIETHNDARITTIVLTRGVPVVTQSSNDPKCTRGTAHMLALMEAPEDARTAAQQMEFKRNPIYKTDVSIDPRAPADGTAVYAVGILNAWTVDDVKRMIDLSVASDPKRPEGTIYLGQSKQGDPRGMYNGAFPKLAEWIASLGLKAEIVPHNPGNSLLESKNDVVYFAFGQANWDDKFPAKNKYTPGAVIDNLTSVALTARAFDAANKGGQTPMTHFVAAGATVVHGCVLEPTTAAWDPSYLHVQRYLEGYAVLESFYMGHPVMPWMNLVAGDPLTQPFAQRPTVTLDAFDKVLPPVAGGKPSYRLKATAKATREGAAVKRLTLYVDGVVAGEATTATAEFELKDFDPLVNTWRVVAEDDSKFRTQGGLASEPLKKEVGKAQAALDKVSKNVATIKLATDKDPVVTWACATSKERTATRKGKTISVTLEGDGPHVVDVWVRNAKEPAAFTIEIPAAKK